MDPDDTSTWLEGVQANVDSWKERLACTTDHPADLEISLEDGERFLGSLGDTRSGCTAEPEAVGWLRVQDPRETIRYIAAGTDHVPVAFRAGMSHRDA